MIMSADMQLLSSFSYWCVLLSGSLSFTVWLVCASLWCCGPVICIITMGVSKMTGFMCLQWFSLLWITVIVTMRACFFACVLRENNLFRWWIGHWEQISIFKVLPALSVLNNEAWEVLHNFSEVHPVCKCFCFREGYITTTGEFFIVLTRSWLSMKIGLRTASSTKCQLSFYVWFVDKLTSAESLGW